MDLDVVKLYKWEVYQQKMWTMLAWPCTLRGYFFLVWGVQFINRTMHAHIVFTVSQIVCAQQHREWEGRQAKTHHPGFEVTHSFHVIYIYYILVGEWFGTHVFSIQLGIIIPTDFHSIIFQRGRCTTNQEWIWWMAESPGNHRKPAILPSFDS